MTSRRSSIIEQGVVKSSLDKRRVESQANADRQRAAILHAKRVRLDSSPPKGHEELTTEELQGKVSELRTSIQKNNHPSLTLLRELRRHVSTGQAAGEQAVAANLIPALAEVLQLRQSGDVAVTEARVEAAWALTNLAALSGPVAAAVTQTAPALIACLSPTTPTVLANQAAWAVGNLAAEGGRAPAQIEGLGGITALLGLMARGLDPLDTGPATGASCTAAWALYILALSIPSKVGFVVLGEKNRALLKRLLNATEIAPEVVAEVLWLLTALSAGDVHVAVPLLHAPELLPAVFGLLPSLLPGECGGQNEASPCYAVPLVRLTGHLAAAACTAREQADLLAAGLDQGIAPLLHCGSTPCTADGSTPTIAAEAAWALSNIAGLDGRAGANLILEAGGLAAAVALVAREGRHQLEALHLLANLLAGGGGGRGDREVISRALGDRRLPALLVPLLGSPDTGLAVLALQVLEMLLRCGPPEGSRWCQGVWNALQELVSRGREAPVREMAAALLQGIHSGSPSAACP